MSIQLQQSNDYPYIRAWGKEFGSYPYYINRAIERARAVNAPHDTVYLTLKDEPTTLSELKNEEVKRKLIRSVHGPAWTCWPDKVEGS
jgi:hypothetical protein